MILAAIIQWQSPHLLWLAAIFAAAATMAVVWLYRTEVMSVRAPWWWVLLGLRLLALGALAVSVLRPVVLRPVRAEERGTVVLLVDESRSMSVVDTGRSPGQLVELADGMGLLPAGVRSRTLDELRQRTVQLRQAVDQAARARSELEYARLSGRAIEMAQSHLRQSADAFAAEANALARSAASVAAPLVARYAEVAGALPTEGDDSWGARMGQKIDQIIEQIERDQDRGDAELYAANSAVKQTCDELAACSRIELVRRALNGEQGLLARLRAEGPVRVFGLGESLTPQPPEGPLSAVASAVRSDLSGAVREARQQMAAQRVAGVVLISDGRQVGGDGSAVVGGAAWGDAPVFAVNPAPAGTRDVAFERITLPPSTAVGQTITVRADLRNTGFPDGPAEVALEAAGERLTKLLTLGEETARVEFPIRFEQPGPQEIRLSVAPRPGEATAQNNQLIRQIKVVSQKIKVALAGGVATWDYQCLRSALGSAPGIVRHEQLLDGSGGPRRWRLSPAEIVRQDVVILSDVPGPALDETQWDALARLAGERGGSVVLIFADPATADSYAARPLAAELLPWRGDAEPTWRVWPGEAPYFRLAPPAEDVPGSLRLVDDPELNRTAWNRLPGVYRIVAPPPLKPGAHPLLVERQAGIPALIESRIGAGRVFFFGCGETWRWRNAGAGGGDLPERFWLQLVHYAGPEPYAVERDGLALDVNKLLVEPGEPLTFRARAAPARPASATSAASRPATIALAVGRDGQPLPDVKLAPVGTSGDQFQATVVDLAPGQYVFRLASGHRQVSLPIRVAESDELEMRDVSPDPVNLRRLAGQGGRLLGLGDLRSLPGRLAELRKSEPQLVEVRLWDSPYLFCFVLGCLGVEWAVRKRVGLV